MLGCWRAGGLLGSSAFLRDCAYKAPCSLFNLPARCNFKGKAGKPTFNSELCSGAPDSLTISRAHPTDVAGYIVVQAQAKNEPMELVGFSNVKN